MAVLTAPPLTLEEFAQLPRGSQRHEVNGGELITMPPAKSLHSRIARNLLKALEAALDRSEAAEAFAEAGYILSRTPLTIRQPDVSVLSKDRIRATSPDDYFEGAPELAVEIVSPSDPADDLEIKIEQYLQAGARQVWVLYPKTRRIHVFKAGAQTYTVYDDTQTLDAADLLPGFSVKVADLFISESRANA